MEQYIAQGKGIREALKEGMGLNWGTLVKKVSFYCLSGKLNLGLLTPQKIDPSLTE